MVLVWFWFGCDVGIIAVWCCMVVVWFWYGCGMVLEWFRYGVGMVMWGPSAHTPRTSTNIHMYVGPRGPGEDALVTPRSP
jgi:hypothetical protein